MVLEGGAGIAHDALLRIAGGFREVFERWGLEGEVGGVLRHDGGERSFKACRFSETRVVTGPSNGETPHPHSG